MGRQDAASTQEPENDVAAPVRRFAVTVGKPVGDSVRRVEAPARLLRVWSLLEATYEQMADGALPPEGMPRLEHQLRVIRRELESTVSPALAVELRRIAPPHDEQPSAAGLRIEYAVLTSWTGSLVMRMLSVLVAARDHPPTPDGGLTRARAQPAAADATGSAAS